MFNEFFLRVRQRTDIRTQADLARALKVSRSAVSVQKKNDTLPKDWPFILADRYGLRAEWLRHGTGEPFSGGVMVAGQPLDACQGRQLGYGRDPSTARAEALPPDSMSALLWEHERRFRELDMPESQIAEQLRTILGARAAQARRREAEEQALQVREAPARPRRLHEDEADYGEPETMCFQRVDYQTDIPMPGDWPRKPPKGDRR